MIVYSFLFSLIVICGYAEISNLSRKSVFYLALGFIIIIWLFQALRWTTGTDWYPYSFFFTKTQGFNEFYNSNFEIGYSLLNYVVGILSSNYTFFLIIFCGLFGLFYGKFTIQNSPFYFPVILYIFSTALFPVRQDLAMVMVFSAYGYILKNRKINFFILVLLATTIHRTAIIFLPTCFFVDKQYKAWQLFVLYVVGLYLGANGFFTEVIVNSVLPNSADMSDIMSEKMHTILTNNDQLTPARILLSFLNGSAWLLFFLYFRKKIEPTYSRQYNIFLNIYVLSLFVNRLFVTSIPEFARFAMYFSGGFIILITIILKNSKLEFRYFLFSFLAVFCFFKLRENINRYPDLFLPYINIFSGYERPVY